MRVMVFVKATEDMAEALNLELQKPHGGTRGTLGVA